MSKPYINPAAYLQALSEARHQLEFGTELRAMVNAVGELRDLNPEHPVIAALEGRISRASQIAFATLRAKMATRTRA